MRQAALSLGGYIRALLLIYSSPLPILVITLLFQVMDSFNNLSVITSAGEESLNDTDKEFFGKYGAAVIVCVIA